MAWPDKLKIKKGLILSLNEAGFKAPKEVQQKTLARIAGGQDLVVIGPEGCGKTTTYVLAVLNRFNYTPDGVPHVLILVPDKDRVEAVIQNFSLINSNRSIAIVGLYATPGLEAQMDALAEGADIVVATPDRARAIYLKLGLNLNKVDLLILDDAELIAKQGLQLPVTELANSINGGQHLVFTEVMHERLNKMISPFMKLPATIEIEETGIPQFEMHEQVLYHVPNFGTKVNLLNLFVADEDLFTKVVVFVNTKPTAEKLFKSLQSRSGSQVSIYKPWFFDWAGYTDVDAFKSSDSRILIVVNDAGDKPDLDNIPFLIHFELPVEKEVYIERMINHYPEINDEVLALTFATDLELSTIKKIEQATGTKITLGELPDELTIEKERKTADPDAKPAKPKTDEHAPGEAFHEKKASNAKTYNYRAGLKAKMSNKRKH